MTRKHFELVALAFAVALSEMVLTDDEVARMAAKMATKLKSANSRFDEDRFVDAVVSNYRNQF
jgi:hypothetical protein